VTSIQKDDFVSKKSCLGKNNLFFADISQTTGGLNMSRKKRQVCFQIEESIVKEMEEIRETGVPVSTQIEFRLKGFTITSVAEKGRWDKVWHWHPNSEKDEEFADKVVEAVERMWELKLH
jgi:hypothetical protein